MRVLSQEISTVRCLWRRSPRLPRNWSMHSKRSNNYVQPMLTLIKTNPRRRTQKRMLALSITPKRKLSMLSITKISKGWIAKAKRLKNPSTLAIQKSLAVPSWYFRIKIGRRLGRCIQMSHLQAWWALSAGSGTSSTRKRSSPMKKHMKKKR